MPLLTARSQASELQLAEAGRLLEATIAQAASHIREIEDQQRQLREFEDQQYQLELELEQMNGDMKRLRQRSAHDLAQSTTRAREEILQSLLPLLDDLERAARKQPSELTNHPWATGIVLIAKRLPKVLSELGITTFGKKDEVFNVFWHTAVDTQPRDDLPEGTIIEVEQMGYALDKQLLRPAYVIVAVAPNTEQQRKHS